MSDNIAGITVSGTCLGILIGAILGAIIGGSIGAAASWTDPTTKQLPWGISIEVSGGPSVFAVLIGAVLGAFIGVIGGAVVGTLFGARWAQKVSDRSARPVQERANLESAAHQASGITALDQARPEVIPDRSHQEAIQPLEERTRANPVLSPTRCPACGEALIPQDVRCPGCDLFLR
jgi:hypothetical protein